MHSVLPKQTLLKKVPIGSHGSQTTYTTPCHNTKSPFNLEKWVMILSYKVKSISNRNDLGKTYNPGHSLKLNWDENREPESRNVIDMLLFGLGWVGLVSIHRIDLFLKETEVWYKAIRINWPIWPPLLMELVT